MRNIPIEAQQRSVVTSAAPGTWYLAQVFPQEAQTD
jgi:hypothetical protein